MGVASDRACIASNGKIQPFFSEQDVISCCAVCGDCYGGDPIRALHYWTTQGLVTGPFQYFLSLRNIFLKILAIFFLITVTFHPLYILYFPICLKVPKFQ
jgi:hypothetical protein